MGIFPRELHGRDDEDFFFNSGGIQKHRVKAGTDVWPTSIGRRAHGGGAQLSAHVTVHLSRCHIQNVQTTIPRTKKYMRTPAGPTCRCGVLFTYHVIRSSASVGQSNGSKNSGDVATSIGGQANPLEYIEIIERRHMNTSIWVSQGENCKWLIYYCHPLQLSICAQLTSSRNYILDRQV
jgi:hypothetical protein